MGYIFTLVFIISHRFKVLLGLPQSTPVLCIPVLGENGPDMVCFFFCVCVCVCVDLRLFSPFFFLNIYGDSFDKSSALHLSPSAGH